MINRFFKICTGLSIIVVTTTSVLAMVPYQLSGTVSQLSLDIRQIVVDTTRYELSDQLLIDGIPSDITQLPIKTGSHIGITLRQQALGDLPLIEEIWLLDTQEESQ
ncbi:MAG: PilY2 family type 4a fimbrial biogenesis protein [Methylophaga sp.]|nr:PilY2 family type 4a fimbrial biogenesis protein [Methylophaga sp.]